MEDKLIKVMKIWPKLILIRDIQIFIDFANFYQRFISDFSRIAILLTFFLKTTRLLRLASKAFRADNDKIVDSGDNRTNTTVMNLSKNKKSKKLMRKPNIRATKEPNFLPPNTKKTFNFLGLAFIKAPILRYLDSKSHIRIKINISSYIISRMLSQ